jgi:dTDP-glucose pyrophosphorylase/predicted transcriptional regulator
LLKDIFIQENSTIKETLKKLDKTAKKVLLIIDNDKKLIGSITDGDIRRFLLKGNPNLEANIKDVYHRNPICLKKSEFSLSLVKEMLTEYKIEIIPVVDTKNRVIDYISWDQAFLEDNKGLTRLPPKTLNIPVVIMAGGRGTRLEPFTKILPKPLIPIGDKTIIETIIDRFYQQGIKKYYLTLNFKGEMIEAYFKGIKKSYKISYVWEKAYLGTAGSLKLLDKNLEDTFIVSNCDVLVNVDIAEVVNFHLEKKSVITILSSIQHYKIPYGVVNFKEGGEVSSITEKPEYTLTINTGVYILSKAALEYIPENKYFDMNELIEKLIKEKKRVITYLLNESDYIDIGQWEEYKKSINQITF